MIAVFCPSDPGQPEVGLRRFSDKTDRCVSTDFLSPAEARRLAIDLLQHAEAAEQRTTPR